MIDWFVTLQALAVPALLAVSVCALIVADLLLPHDAPAPAKGPHPIGGGKNRGPISFRELQSGVSGLAQGEPVAVQDSARTALPWIALGQIVVVLAIRLAAPATGLAAGGAFVDDAWARFLQVLVLLAGALAVLGLRAHGLRHWDRRQVELYALLLSCLCGMTLLAGARDLLLLAVAFELMGIPLYALCAWQKTDSGKASAPLTIPAEAGLKLYLVGAVSSAVTLYGISLLFGLTGTTAISGLHAAPTSLLTWLAVAFVLAGFGFKLGLAPFHLWIPDTYQGAPTPVVSFLSVAPKVAGLAALVRVLADGLGPCAGRWLPLLIGLSVATMLAGNLLALPQLNLKRLMGNSGVAQMGTVLLGFVALGAGLVGRPGVPQDAAVEGLASVLFYGAAYLPANTGVFLVLEAVAARTPPDDRDMLGSLAGLHKRHAGLAVAALVCLLSLAGIPFAVGFWAKLWAMLAAWQAGYPWLVLAAAGLGVFGLFYYLRVARAMYLGQPQDASPILPDRALGVAIALCALATAGIGLYPRPLIEAATVAAAALLP
jgi:NADH-quinone oxidoreductase subunit N